MELKKVKLGEIADVDISSVDKKCKEEESPVRLCNFVDVYYNWAVTADMEASLGRDSWSRPAPLARQFLK